MYTTIEIIRAMDFNCMYHPSHIVISTERFGLCHRVNSTADEDWNDLIWRLPPATGQLKNSPIAFLASDLDYTLICDNIEAVYLSLHDLYSSNAYRGLLHVALNVD
jgi:hypothetical protein